MSEFVWVMERCDICADAPEPCIHCWQQRAVDAERVIDCWLAAGVVSRVACDEDHGEYEGADQDCCEGAGWTYYHGALRRLSEALTTLADSVDRDRREPDKILCHVASARRALFDATGETTALATDSTARGEVMPATAKGSSLPLRAAQYFGIHDEPRTSVRIDRRRVVIVTPKALYVYDEDWGQAGRIIPLTDTNRSALVEALEQTRAL